MLALITLALARPTEGGQWSFDDTDVIATLEGPNGTARVWYSTEGPNQVVLDDDDGDGVPDFAQLVATYTEDVLGFYEDAGFRAPLSDEGRGGSDAMDVYLVDFAGNADGAYTAESCTSGEPKQCSGYFVMENDFAGYGYSSRESAVSVLTSHELFHAVQAAYDAEEDVWFSEGTAVWAEQLYDPLNEDFLSFCSAYLEDAGRSLDEPPTGPVPAFAYATTIWWWFLSNRYGDAFIVDLMEATDASDDLLEEMVALEEAAGGSLGEDFATFARWNLATGARAGVMESYPFASSLARVRAEDDGASIVTENRFYPVAATYFELEHEGGEVHVGLAEPSPSLALSLHAEDADGRAEEALDTWNGADGTRSFGELPAGSYWIVVSNPTLDQDSTKVTICVGDEAALEACGGADTGAPADTGGDEEPGGCGCGTSSAAPGWAALAAGLLLARRRRLSAVG